MQQVVQRDPNYPQAVQLVQQNGGDAQKAFYSLANQMGVDPQQILDVFK